ncbi:hypothetical protein [Flavobacterium sp.]|uniref:hypothetical protein n=1 Tax=Flavobacterium sp. TaxID=239 RepID=UPI002B786B25|nr:hypothetical protein [Flavobacterium sp.]HSD09135.1 hypothetical protein [Flavobacterium sp.]
MRKLIFLIVLAINAICYAQNEVPQREPFTLNLVVNNNEPYVMELKKGDYFVNKKVLQIYSSEKLNVEVEFKNDSIYSMKVVKNIVNPKNTIIVELKQDVKDQKSLGSTLSVKNPFDKKLNYNAVMFIVGVNKWIPTEVTPVAPNETHFEKWDDVLVTLVLDKWKLEK